MLSFSFCSRSKQTVQFPSSRNNTEIPSHLNLQRTLTVPARRGRLTRSRGVSEVDSDSLHRLPIEQHSYSGGGVDNLSHLASSPTGPITEDDIGTERTIVRVRNFSTKSGNLINRGDSIKFRNRGSAESSDAGRSGKGQRGVLRQQRAHASVSRNNSQKSEYSVHNSVSNKNLYNGGQQSFESDIHLEECPCGSDALSTSLVIIFKSQSLLYFI